MLHLSSCTESGDSQILPLSNKERNKIRVQHLGYYFIKSSVLQHNCLIFIITIQFQDPVQRTNMFKLSFPLHKNIQQELPPPNSRRRAAATPECHGKQQAESLQFKDLIALCFFGHRELT